MADRHQTTSSTALSQVSPDSLTSLMVHSQGNPVSQVSSARPSQGSVSRSSTRRMVLSQDSPVSRAKVILMVLSPGSQVRRRSAANPGSQVSRTRASLTALSLVARSLPVVARMEVARQPASSSARWF